MNEGKVSIRDIMARVKEVAHPAKYAKAFLAAAVVGAISVSAFGTAQAQEDFYKGKQITLVVSSAAGGLYDAYARLTARFLPQHIPGNPKVIVQNMPGAGGLQATNYIYNVAPKDGTVIAGTHSNVPTAQLLTPDGAKFDANKLSWIGSITTEPFVGYVWETSPVQTLEEAKKTQITMGGTTFGAAGVDMVILSNAWFGTKFNLVSGYGNAADVKLALESGEVDGTFANSWSDVKSQASEWITDHKIKILVQYGSTPHPDLPDVPLFIDQAQNDEQVQALELLLARQEFSKPYFAPPDIPADRLEILRKAFDEMVADSEFLAAAEGMKLSVDQPMTGDELAARVSSLSQTPSSVVEMIQKLFTDYNNGVR